MLCGLQQLQIPLIGKHVFILHQQTIRPQLGEQLYQLGKGKLKCIQAVNMYVFNRESSCVLTLCRYPTLGGAPFRSKWTSFFPLGHGGLFIPPARIKHSKNSTGVFMRVHVLV